MNRPSLVLSDNIDIVYQIRHILAKTKLNIVLTCTDAARPNPEHRPSPIEKLMEKMHCGATPYYRSKLQQRPKSKPIPFPAQQVCIHHKSSPIVTNTCQFLQESERKTDHEEYFLQKFNIDPKGMSDIDTYTLGRVIQRNKHRHFVYTKIIHSQLNTMTVNKKWKIGNDICPICHNVVEDWYHVLTCKDKDLHRTRETFITDFRKLMNKHRTYPPLRDFFIDCLRYPTFDAPPQPLI